MKTLRDYVIHFKNVMPRQMCADLIRIYDSISHNDPNYVVRKNNIYDFAEINMLDHVAFAEYCRPMLALMQAVNTEYTKRVSQNLQSRLQCFENFKDFETPRIKRYEPNVGKFDWHLDCASLESSRRAIVLFWYLNDVIQGGETEFDLDGEVISIKPEAGSVVVFPPHWMFPHRGCTPISGPKYVISSYVLLPDGPAHCD